MNPFHIMLIALFAPALPLIARGRWKFKRQAAQRECEGDNILKPFDPEPEAVPGFFLRHFTQQQRAYFRPQLSLAKGCYYVAGWFYIVLCCGGLLPGNVNEYGTQQLLSQRAWYSYLNQISNVSAFAVIVPLFAAIMAAASFSTPTEGFFYRTRPLHRRFLFWGRIGAAAASLLAAQVTGLAVSLVLLVAFYGPVWKHLFDQPAPVAGTLTSLRTQASAMVVFPTNARQAVHLYLISLTSVPRLFLSMLTTALLVFAVVVALFTLPKRPSLLAKGGFFGQALLWVVVVASPVLSRLHILRFSGLWFFYSNLGPPPPYIFAAVPLTIAVVLLYLGSIFMSRLET